MITPNTSVKSNNQGTPIIPQNFPTNSTPLSRWNWGRFFQAVIEGLASGGLVGAACGGASYAIGQLKPPVLPAGELELIMNWYKNEFIPYFNTIVAEGNDLLENNFGIQSLSRLNILENKLCTIHNFYTNVNNDVSISQEGINFRKSLVEPYITAVSDLLRDKAASLDAETTTAAFNSASFVIPILPQPQVGTVICTNYVAKGSSIQTQIKTNPATTSFDSGKNQGSNMSWLWLSLAVGTVVYLLATNEEEEEN